MYIMKKQSLRVAVLFFCAVFAGMFASCGKYYGEPTTKHYSISGNYTELNISHAFDVTVSETATDAVVTVPEDLHSKLKLEVKNGTLYIGFTRSIIVSYSECKVVLPVNMQLEDLELSGASSFRGNLQGTSSDIEISGASEFYGDVTASDIDFEISGASDYKGTVVCDEVDMNLSGASNATIQGACTGTMDIDVSGASNLHAIDFNTDAVTGSLSGSSDADVTVCSRIAVNVSGASDLTYGTSSPACHPTFGCTLSGSSTAAPR